MESELLPNEVPCVCTGRSPFPNGDANKPGVMIARPSHAQVRGPLSVIVPCRKGREKGQVRGPLSVIVVERALAVAVRVLGKGRVKGAKLWLWLWQ